MAGLFALLYGLLWGTSKVATTIMDENSKAESKANAIQKGDCVYSDRHGRYYSVRTGEQVYYGYDTDLKRNCYYKYVKGGGTVVVEDPEKIKIEERKKQEEQWAISMIMDDFKEHIRCKKYWVLLDVQNHIDENRKSWFIDVLVKLDENRIFYYTFDGDLGRMYLKAADEPIGNWHDITRTRIDEEIRQCTTLGTFQRDKRLLPFAKKLSSYDLILNYDFKAIKEELIEKYGYWGEKRRAKSEYQQLIDETYEKMLKEKRLR